MNFKDLKVISAYRVLLTNLFTAASLLIVSFWKTANIPLKEEQLAKDWIMFPMSKLIAITKYRLGNIPVVLE